MTITKHRRPDDLQEWVDYYSSIGFDHITIFDNDSSFSIENMFRFNPKVTVMKSSGNFDATERGYPNQLNLATLFFMEKKRDTDWMAWFDDDEFLYLRDTNNVKDILKNELPAICFYWKMMSLPNVIENRSGTLIETFNYSTNETPHDNHAHLKTIVNLGKFTNIRWPTAHLPILDGREGENLGARTADGEIVKEEHKIIDDGFYNQSALLYHYFHQSWEDRKFKIYRGGVLNNGKRPYSEDIEIFKREIEGKYIHLDNSMIKKKDRVIRNFKS